MGRGCYKARQILSWCSIAPSCTEYISEYSAHHCIYVGGPWGTPKLPQRPSRVFFLSQRGIPGQLQLQLQLQLHFYGIAVSAGYLSVFVTMSTQSVTPPQKKFNCALCQRKFNRREHLQRHERIR